MTPSEGGGGGGGGGKGVAASSSGESLPSSGQGQVRLFTPLRSNSGLGSPGNHGHRGLYPHYPGTMADLTPVISNSNIQYVDHTTAAATTATAAGNEADGHMSHPRGDMRLYRPGGIDDSLAGFVVVSPAMMTKNNMTGIHDNDHDDDDDDDGVNDSTERNTSGNATASGNHENQNSLFRRRSVGLPHRRFPPPRSTLPLAKRSSSDAGMLQRVPFAGQSGGAGPSVITSVVPRWMAEIEDGASPAAPSAAAAAAEIGDEGRGGTLLGQGLSMPVDGLYSEESSVENSNHHDHNATSPAPPTHQWTLPEPSPPSHSRALVVHSPRKPSSRPRGLEPDEAACRGRSGRDPPGEAPDERPFIGAPRVVRRSGDASVGSHASGNSRTGPWNARSVQWVDPKTVANEGDIDFGVLRHYERLVGEGGCVVGGGVDGNDDSREYRGMDADGASSPPLHSRSGLLTPKRIRIATISSGYKKANFFVREDLDQRIYFHDLEDAINYMAKRGYARMRKEEELEWMKLLGKAHGVVKVGPTKKKQRYRKGKLVLILSKPITDDYPFRTTSKKRQPSSPHTHVTTLALVARQHTPSDESTAASSHTSIGRSIRGPYKSYSEKFLAEQEEEKRLLLGQPPPRLMMLMNGPVDPEPQQELLQLTNGSGDEDEDEAISEGDEESSSKMSASKKSSNASEARMVNYRGGVMYFTPHQYEESDDDDDEETEGEEGDSHQEDDDDDDTEDESAKHDDEEEEEETTVNSEEESAHSGMESRHSNADSSTNSEMSSIARNSGVKIVPGGNGKSTLNSNRAPTPYDKVAMRRNRQSSPPEMEPISDDSEDSSLVSGEA
ncbi:hypothetical protein ACHAXS_009319 [Conticribra weissflogii]